MIITTFDNFTYNLKIGAKTPGNEYNLTVAVTADFPKESDWTAGKDEKPEDKKKIDQVYQDKMKPLQAKLQQEQALGQWTYLVSSWLVDPLIRNRSQLMVEKTV